MALWGPCSEIAPVAVAIPSLIHCRNYQTRFRKVTLLIPVVREPHHKQRHCDGTVECLVCTSQLVLVQNLCKFFHLLCRELKDGSLCDNNIQDESNLTLVLHTETGVRVSDSQLVLHS